MRRVTAALIDPIDGSAHEYPRNVCDQHFAEAIDFARELADDHEIVDIPDNIPCDLCQRDKTWDDLFGSLEFANVKLNHTPDV